MKNVGTAMAPALTGICARRKNDYSKTSSTEAHPAIEGISFAVNAVVATFR